MTVRLFAVLLALTAALVLAGCGDTLTEPATDDTGAAVKDGTTDARAQRQPRRQERAAGQGKLSGPSPSPARGPRSPRSTSSEVKGRAPKTGYDREQFGGDWATVNGCDMRNRILARDLDDIVYEVGSDCEISGRRAGRPVHRHADPVRAAAARARSTSTTSSRSATPGRKARSSGATSSACSSPTTR